MSGEEEEIVEVEVDEFEEDEDYDARHIKYHYIKESVRSYSSDEADVDEYWERGFAAHDGEFFRCDTSEIFHADRACFRQFPTRYRLKDFKLSKSLRRVLNKNRDLRTVVRPLRVTPEKAALYEKHFLKLADKCYEQLDKQYLYNCLELAPLMETCAFLGDRLVASSIFQVGERGAYGNHAFWDLEYPRRSLGILTALLEMDYARRKGLRFYYLGPYYKENPNYHYKLRFPALEFYDWDNAAWVDAKQAGELLKQKLSYHYKKDTAAEYLQFFGWVAHSRPELVGVAATGGATDDDLKINVLYLTTDLAKMERRLFWIELFGSPSKVIYETTKKSLKMKAFYRNDAEFEFYFVEADWMNPDNVDEKTRRIVTGEMQVLHDPHGILEKLQKERAGET